MHRDDFLSQLDRTYTPSTVAEMQRIWVRIGQAEQKAGLSLESGLNKEQYIELFRALDIKRTSFFVAQKSYMMQYIQYLVSIGVLSTDHQEALKSVTVTDLSIPAGTWFQDLNALEQAISETMAMSDAVDLAVYDNAVTAAYLAWCGLTQVQAVDLKRTDVLEDTILLEGQELTLPPRIMAHLHQTLDCEGYYRKTASISFHRYLPSEYVLRTNRNDHLTPRRIVSMLDRFSAISDHIFPLRYPVILESGMFFRAYQAERNAETFPIGDLAFAEQVFCRKFRTRQQLISTSHDYELYKMMCSVDKE